MEKVVDCLHCGNRTSMKVISESKEFYEFDGVWEDRKFFLYLCPVCKKVTLNEEYLFSEDIIHLYHVKDDDYRNALIQERTKITTLYPNSNIDDEIPEKVRKAYQAAIDVRYKDGAICVLALRRALEMMANEKGAEGKNLYNKLKDLQNKKILPPLLSEITTLLREEGNAAAHADDREFNESLVNYYIEFTSTILDYVYTVPAKFQRIQQSIKKEQEKI
ncbi:hypothetical protein BTS2_3306 [Bacillus sp. TS-2]|nr:hypothetical protein BTS2_3306 [Bacillus sp. TS-2]